MKRAIVIILVLLVAAAVGWVIFKKKNSNPVSGLKPRVEMSVGRISDITDSTLKMEMTMLVHNPLPIGMEVKNMNYKVQMNGKTIVEDKYNKPFEIKSNDSSVISLPSKLKISKLDAEGDKEANRGEDSADYHFETVIYPKKPILGKDSLEFSMDKRLPIYRLPEIKLADFDLKQLKLKDTEVVIKVQVTNKNPFSVEFKNPTYSMDLGKQKQFAHGKVGGATKVKARSEEVFSIPLSVNLGKALRTTGQLITKGKHLPFTFYFKSKLISESEVLNNSDLNLVMDGELADIGMVKKNLTKEGEEKKTEKDKKE